MRRQLKIILILLAIGGIVFFSLSKGKDILHRFTKVRKDKTVSFKKPGGTEKTTIKDKDSDNKKLMFDDLQPKQKHQKDKSFLTDNLKTIDQNIRTDKNAPVCASVDSESLKDLNSLAENLSEIARYDNYRKGYVLHKIERFEKEKISNDLLSLLKLINRKDMPLDYFQWQEYYEAYKEIDLFYHDTYIWPYFTNTEAKTNFFLYLFSRYAADNEQWRFYEKDRSDCSQFSQRIYMFLSPDEIYMPDTDYFLFLFSNKNNRSERKKLCNKIPNVFYTTITPYILKRDSSETSTDAEGHAMISFAPDNNPENWILGEPQNGEFRRFREDIGSILDEEFTRHPLICKLGKVLSIETDYSHEANTETTGIYFIPKTVFENKRYTQDDPRWDYEDKPIKMNDHTYQLFQLFSFHIKQVVNKQPINRTDFFRSMETISWNANNSPSKLEEAIKSSVDAIMYSLIDLEKSDLQLVQNEMNEIENFTETLHGFSPQINEYMKQLSYQFLLKMEPLL